MANTGYQISPTVRQYFTSGPDSGSVVSASFDVDLTVAPFSASLNDEDFFNRAFDPIDCEPGFEDCQVPILTSLNTGSRRGRFVINYVTASSYLGSNDPLAPCTDVPHLPVTAIVKDSARCCETAIPVLRTPLWQNWFAMFNPGTERVVCSCEAHLIIGIVLQPMIDETKLAVVVLEYSTSHFQFSRLPRLWSNDD